MTRAAALATLATAARAAAPATLATLAGAAAPAAPAADAAVFESVALATIAVCEASRGIEELLERAADPDAEPERTVAPTAPPYNRSGLGPERLMFRICAIARRAAVVVQPGQ
jgi:hypothetical protein